MFDDIMDDMDTSKTIENERGLEDYIDSDDLIHARTPSLLDGEIDDFINGF
tara:strand:+ start:214 stop:366 length:153 start_codon:yes stop_codon:yes gene_type:complete